MERLAELNAEREKYRQLKYDSAKELHNCKQIFGMEVHCLE